MAETNKIDVLAWFDRQIDAHAEAEDGSLSARLGLEAQQARAAVAKVFETANLVALASTPRADSHRFYECDGHYVLDLREALHKVRA